MVDELELIRKIDFFEALEPKIARKVVEACVPKSYSAGDYLIRQGETGLGLFFVVSGQLKVEIEKDGQKAEVARLKEEDFVGELAVIDNKPRSANVICVEDTRCLILTRDAFLKLMNKYPQIAIQMAKSLSERLRSTDEHLTQHKMALAAGRASAAEAAPKPAAEAGESPAPPQPTKGAEAKTVSNGGSSKDRMRDFLVGTFSRFYTLKAMTRFSVAVVGCPVRVRPQERTGVLELEVGELKVAVFPAFENQKIALEATGEGTFSATILRPNRGLGTAACSVSHFGGRLDRDEKLLLHIPAQEGHRPSLERLEGGRSPGFSMQGRSEAQEAPT